MSQQQSTNQTIQNSQEQQRIEQQERKEQLERNFQFETPVQTYTRNHLNPGAFSLQSNSTHNTSQSNINQGQPPLQKSDSLGQLDHKQYQQNLEVNSHVQFSSYDHNSNRRKDLLILFTDQNTIQKISERQVVIFTIMNFLRGDLFNTENQELTNFINLVQKYDNNFGNINNDGEFEDKAQHQAFKDFESILKITKQDGIMLIQMGKYYELDSINDESQICLKELKIKLSEIFELNQEETANLRLYYSQIPYEKAKNVLLSICIGQRFKVRIQDCLKQLAYNNVCLKQEIQVQQKQMHDHEQLLSQQGLTDLGDDNDQDYSRTLAKNCSQQIDVEQLQVSVRDLKKTLQFIIKENKLLKSDQIQKNKIIRQLQNDMEVLEQEKVFLKSTIHKMEEDKTDIAQLVQKLNEKLSILQ